MKKITLTTILLFSIATINSQNVNIPNQDFKDCLVSNSSINTDGDTEISITEAQEYTGTIDCDSRFMDDITGIEEFINITRVDFSWNKLTTLDLSNNLSIKRIDCDFNNLTNIILGNNTNLTFLDCKNNDLETIDVSNIINLEDLECNGNSITSIDLSNNFNLDDIDLSNNQLSDLDLINNVSIRNINCENNLIENLDFSTNTNLSSLDCSDNNLMTLNIDNGKNLFFNLFKADGNSNLTCIQVDNLNNVRTETWDYDPEVEFSTDCQFVLSLDENSFKNNTTVYQNKSKQFVIIQSISPINNIKIYSITGNLIKTAQNATQVDVSSFSKGIYLFTLERENQFLTKKIIIQ